VAATFEFVIDLPHSVEPGPSPDATNKPGGCGNGRPGKPLRSTDCYHRGLIGGRSSRRQLRSIMNGTHGWGAMRRTGALTMKLSVLALGCAMLMIAFAPKPAFAQSGYDRPGGDYLRFSVRSGDPAVCAARCERDSRCRAWAFAYPVIGGSKRAVCWLKNRVPRRTRASCCVSGVRGAGVVEPRRGRVEFSIDRFGGDYRSFDMIADPQGAPCAAACEAEKRCCAWTYARPGYVGTAARCYLKSRIKRPRRSPCCISGVVR